MPREGSGTLITPGGVPREGPGTLIAPGGVPREGSGTLIAPGGVPREGPGTLIARVATGVDISTNVLIYQLRLKKISIILSIILTL